MGVALGWVVFALAGVAAAPPTDRNNCEIIYTVQYIEADGLGWREAALTHLRPVARQGAATVWTAPQSVASRMVAEVTKSKAGKILQTPKVTAANGAPVHIAARSNRQLVTQVSWSGEDRRAAPTGEKVRTGWLATMVGRRLDQGVLVQLVLEDTEISAIHNLKIADSCESRCGKAASAWVPKPADCDGATKAGGVQKTANRTDDVADTVCSEEKCIKAQSCCETANDDAFQKDGEVQQLTIQVPEIRSQEVAGEWLIPKDEVLLVSFGAYTTADPSGKAVVKERLAMIRCMEIAAGPAVDRPQWMAHGPVTSNGAATSVHRLAPPTPVPLLAPPPVVVPAVPINPFALDWGLQAAERAPLTVPVLPASPVLPPHALMPVPAVPSRTIPQGINRDGTISNLPPLPDEIEQPSSESSEPMASPQIKKHQQAKPATDAKAAKASFVPAKAAPFSIPSLFMPSVPTNPAGLQFLLPIKPFAIKLPFKQRLEIEILGRLVPDNEPSSKPAEHSEE
jgi:hypothetical protein